MTGRTTVVPGLTVARGDTYISVAYSAGSAVVSLLLTPDDAVRLARELFAQAQAVDLAATLSDAGVTRLLAAVRGTDPQDCPDRARHGATRGTCGVCEWTPSRDEAEA